MGTSYWEGDVAVIKILQHFEFKTSYCAGWGWNPTNTIPWITQSNGCEILILFCTLPVITIPMHPKKITICKKNTIVEKKPEQNKIGFKIMFEYSVYWWSTSLCFCLVIAFCDHQREVICCCTKQLFKLLDAKWLDNFGNFGSKPDKR